MNYKLSLVLIVFSLLFGCLKEESYVPAYQQKLIVDELLAIYVQNDSIAIEKIDTLNLPNFANMGGLIPCVKIMGGKPKYLSFITELINKIYED